MIKLKLAIITWMQYITILTLAQNSDSLRQVIETMRFDIPVLSPVPASVYGVKLASISLNGTWKFNPDNKDIHKAIDIEVPGEWEMQGFKVVKGTSATYWKTFSLPPDWRGNRVKIRFDGISSYGLVKVNGKTIGSHEGGFVAFDLDITEAVIPGDNILEVEVQCETISDILGTISQYAHHPVGGILRKVTLFALPAIHLSDFSYEVKFDRQYHHSYLTFISKVSGHNNIGKKIHLKMDIQDASGRSVHLRKNTFDVSVNKQVSEVKGILKVKSPKKWDPEHPNLYLLTASLVVDGKVLQINTQKIGFRQIEIHDNQLYINNHPVKLKGVNRHEVHPLRGRSLTPELCRKDVELFRAGNCNFIRTSHYPPSEEFLQACDELGMFVESEAAICWVGHSSNPIWKTSYTPQGIWDCLDTEFLPYLVRANFDNVLSGRNHPCIIIWSLGNESRWSPLWERVNDEIKKLDPSRPAVFHDQCWGIYNNRNSLADIANYHYPGRFYGVSECEKEKTRPVLFGEYVHTQCYARRELETDPSVRSDTWAVTLKQTVDSVYLYPSCLGGAIWSGVDEIFHLSEDKICGTGPWGPVDGWRREKPEYTGMKKSYSPVIITNLKTAKTVNNQIKLDIENRYNFLNLNELMINVKAGSQIFPVHADISPMNKGSIIIDVTTVRQADSLWITFTDPRGFICQEEVIEIARSSTPVLSKVKVNVIFSEDSKACIIKSGETIFIINKFNGALECVTSGGDTVITSGGKMMLVPFNTENGGSHTYTQNIQPLEYKPVDNFIIASVISRKNEDGSVQVILSGVMENKLEGTQEYIFNTDGTITVSYDYITLVDFIKGKNQLRQFGLLFTLPVTFDQLKWERKGLWTIYPEYDINRLKGFAKALPGNLKYVEVPRKVPAGEWKDNSNKQGTNDFRSTKDNILRASLKNDKNMEITVQSDGSQSVRSWIDDEKTLFLVAGLNGPGSCSYFIGPRPEFKKGDHLKGKFTLCVQSLL